MVKFPSEDITESEQRQITPEPEITSNTTMKPPEQSSPEPPSKPEYMQKKQPQALQNQRIQPSNIRIYFHNNIAKPLIGPPAPGNTTFTIALKNKNLTGFPQTHKETKSLKELVPLLSTKAKSLIKLAKKHNYKKDLKNLKHFPSTIKKSIAKIDSNSFKAIPKKFRSLFSSD